MPNSFCNSSGSGTPLILREPSISRKYFPTSIIIPTWPATRPLAGRGKEILSTKPAMVSPNPALFTGITEPAVVESLFDVLGRLLLPFDLFQFVSKTATIFLHDFSWSILLLSPYFLLGEFSWHSLTSLSPSIYFVLILPLLKKKPPPRH